MSLRERRRHIGRLAVVGFSGQSVPPDLARLVAEFDLGGVIYMARNIAAPDQVAELSREVAALALEWPLWISVDQEGGSVQRLKSPFTTWPPAMTLGRSGDEALASRFAKALAAELRAVGISLDYAPVLDVRTNPKNPVIGDRALAEKAEEVARLGAAVIRGLEDNGIAACGKHFPGHGDTTVDSHEGLPVVEHDARRLEAVELVPFRRAVAENVATIMTAHVLMPAVDARRIATFSPTVVDGWLKQKLGYQGVVISDDLGMKAVSADTGLAEASVQAVSAGCDALLWCNSTIDEQVAAIEGLIRAAENGTLSEKRLDDAFRRQHDVKLRMRGTAPGASTALEVIGCEEHLLVASEMATFL